jgi:hypothetical protein
LILDDWGLAPIGDRERRGLLEVIEDRTGRRATRLTSQVPVEHWHDGVGDATFGDAIMDRLVHHAHPHRRLAAQTQRHPCVRPFDDVMTFTDPARAPSLHPLNAWPNWTGCACHFGRNTHHLEGGLSTTAIAEQWRFSRRLI